VRLRVHVGIHAQGDRRARAELARDLVQRAQLAHRLHVEEQDLRLQRVAHLVPRLADAGKDDFLRRHARPQRAMQLAAGDDVGAGAGPGQRRDHGQVRIRLDRIADEMRQVLEGVVVRAIAVEQRGFRVHVRRCADGVGELRQRHRLAAELAVTIGVVGGGGHVQEIVAHGGREVKAR
jgi:hypothetical protein